MTNILNLNGKKKQPSNKGLINAYVCTELHTTITKNIDEGPIPMMIACPLTDCGKPARSMMYQVNQNFHHTIEWYSPDKAELLRMSTQYEKPAYLQMVELVQKGGLISRLVEPTKPK